MFSKRLTFMEFIMSIYCLVGKIKGLVTETYYFKNRIKRCIGQKKPITNLIDIRKDIRSDARHHHLAYAFLSGTKYSQLEQRCNIKPDVGTIVKIVKFHLNPKQTQAKGLYHLTDDELKAKIINWLCGV